MKTLLTIALACLCLFANAQLSVTLKRNGFYSPDSIGSVKLYQRKYDDQFMLSPYVTKNGYFAAKYYGTQVFIDTSQIEKTSSYKKYLQKVIPGVSNADDNPYGLLIKIDYANKLAYYQDAIQIDSSIRLDELQYRIKRFAGNSAPSSFEPIGNNNDKMSYTFTDTEGLFIPQGVGSMRFDVRYSMTVDIKKGKYRYTVSNVEIAYTTLMLSHGERKPLFDEYLASRDGTYYDNHIKRIISFEKYLTGKIKDLNIIMAQKTKVGTSDF